MNLATMHDEVTILFADIKVLAGFEVKLYLATLTLFA